MNLSALERAQALIDLDGLSLDEQRGVVSRLQKLTEGMRLEDACASMCEESVHARLEPGGWVVDMSDHLKPHHVYAIAVRLSEDELQRQILLGEALFMAGRIDMKQRIEQEEARKRSERGSRGGAPVRVDEAKLRELWEAFARRGSKVGRIKWIAGQLGVDGRTVSGHAKRLNLPP